MKRIKKLLFLLPLAVTQCDAMQLQLMENNPNDSHQRSQSLASRPFTEKERRNVATKHKKAEIQKYKTDLLTFVCMFEVEKQINDLYRQTGGKSYPCKQKYLDAFNNQLSLFKNDKTYNENVFKRTIPRMVLGAFTKHAFEAAMIDYENSKRIVIDRDEIGLNLISAAIILGMVERFKEEDFLSEPISKETRTALNELENTSKNFNSEEEVTNQISKDYKAKIFHVITRIMTAEEFTKNVNYLNREEKNRENKSIRNAYASRYATKAKIIRKVLDYGYKNQVTSFFFTTAITSLPRLLHFFWQNAIYTVANAIAIRDTAAENRQIKEGNENAKISHLIEQDREKARVQAYNQNQDKILQNENTGIRRKNAVATQITQERNKKAFNEWTYQNNLIKADNEQKTQKFIEDQFAYENSVKTRVNHENNSRAALNLMSDASKRIKGIRESNKKSLPLFLPSLLLGPPAWLLYGGFLINGMNAESKSNEQRAQGQKLLEKFPLNELPPILPEPHQPILRKELERPTRQYPGLQKEKTQTSQRLSYNPTEFTGLVEQKKPKLNKIKSLGVPFLRSTFLDTVKVWTAWQVVAKTTKIAEDAWDKMPELPKEKIEKILKSGKKLIKDHAAGLFIGAGATVSAAALFTTAASVNMFAAGSIASAISSNLAAKLFIKKGRNWLKKEIENYYNFKPGIFKDIKNEFFLKCLNELASGPTPPDNHPRRKKMVYHFVRMTNPILQTIFSIDEDSQKFNFVTSVLGVATWAAICFIPFGKSAKPLAVRYIESPKMVTFTGSSPLVGYVSSALGGKGYRLAFGSQAGLIVSGSIVLSSILLNWVACFKPLVEGEDGELEPLAAPVARKVKEFTDALNITKPNEIKNAESPYKIPSAKAIALISLAILLLASLAASLLKVKEVK